MMSKLSGQIRTAPWILSFVTVVAVTGLSNSGHAQPDNAILVDVGNLPDCGDGLTWNTAFAHLQDAIGFALANPDKDEIWVAKGTYYPDRDCNFPSGTGATDDSFEMDIRFTILGGFAGGETDANQRDFDMNPTILSGDLTQNDSASTPFIPPNSWHVLTFIDDDILLNHNAKVDGFTITAGNAIAPEDNFLRNDAGGGALLLSDLNEIGPQEGVPGPTFENCRFEGNGANAFGGAVAGRNIGVNLTNCYFGNNISRNINTNPVLALNGGGAVTISGPTNVVLSNFFQNTSGGRGGALEFIGELPQGGTGIKLVDCKFWENTASHEGGAVAVDAHTGYIVNCLFAGNVALGTFNKHGGGFFGGLPVVNSTFVANEARDPDFMDPNPEIMGTAVGGGAFFPDGSTIDNCIFWGNSAQNEQGLSDPVWQVQQVWGDDCPDYSDIDGFDPDDCSQCAAPDCDGTINLDPFFADPDGPDMNPDTFVDNDYRLIFCSPCVETGDEDQSVIPCDEFDLDLDGQLCLPGSAEATPDLDLNDRLLDNADQDATARVDMGAYEFVTVNPVPWDCQPIPDGFVHITDLLALLGQWGQVCTSCDRTGPGVGVGIADLLALLAAWDPPPSGPQTIEEAVTDAGLEWPDAWNDFVDIMADPDPDEAKQANWLCWMDHYLECHPKFFCFECACQICPDSDPWEHPMH